MQVSVLLYNAARIAGILGAPGRLPSPSETDDFLSALNGMLDAWQTERLLVFCELQHTVNLVVGQRDYTIGLSGATDFALPRPEQIDRAGLVLNTSLPSTEIPLNIYSDQQWAAVTPKDMPSTMPQGLWYQRTVPNGIITFWPKPQIAYDVNLYLWQNLQTVVDATVNIDLPPGYQSAIEYNLAIELAGRFQERAKISAWHADKAARSKATLKIMNSENLLMRVEQAAMGGAGHHGLYQILSNTYYNGGNQ